MQKDDMYRKTQYSGVTASRAGRAVKLQYAVVFCVLSVLLAGSCTYLVQQTMTAGEKAGYLNKISELEVHVKILEEDNTAKDRELNTHKVQLESLNNNIKTLEEKDKVELNRRISEQGNEINSLRQRYNNLYQTVTGLKGKTGDQFRAVIAPRAKDALSAIKNSDMKMLSAMVHPEKGVRFSPYAYVDSKNHRILKSVQIENGLNDKAQYTWGSFDGSGDSIKMSFREYLDRFVYNKDYAGTDQIGYNQFISGGNTINNAFEIYPEAVIVEYYLPGTNPKYGGMDYGGLRLVFEESSGTWYLVGIIHNEWTI